VEASMKYLVLSSVIFSIGCASISDEEKLYSSLETVEPRSGQVLVCQGRHQNNMTCGYVDSYRLQQDMNLYFRGFR
jgi:hypothetical protein